MFQPSMIKTDREIKILREGGKILREVLNTVAEKVKEGAKKEISSLELEELARKIVHKYQAEPSFLNYPVSIAKNKQIIKYPAALCISLNNEIVHGIPRPDKIIKNGDLVKFDFGVKYKNLYTDAALTVTVGQTRPVAKKLLEVTKNALKIGLKEIKPGNKLGKYGFVVENYVRENDFQVVKKLVGHGVGYAVHEPPNIPNYGRPNKGLKLKEGMVLALEPMVNELSEDIQLDNHDGFAYTTIDGGWAAHFEETVVVTKNGCEILTK